MHYFIISLLSDALIPSHTVILLTSVSPAFPSVISYSFHYFLIFLNFHFIYLLTFLSISLSPLSFLTLASLLFFFRYFLLPLILTFSTFPNFTFTSIFILSYPSISPLLSSLYLLFTLLFPFNFHLLTFLTLHLLVRTFLIPCYSPVSSVQCYLAHQ